MYPLIWMVWFWREVPRYSYAKRSATKIQAIVWNFPISETGSKCNSVFRHDDRKWVIVMELKRKVEYRWEYTFSGSLYFNGYRSLPWTWNEVRYYKLSIVTGVTITSIFFFKSLICVYSILSRCIPDSNLLM